MKREQREYKPKRGHSISTHLNPVNCQQTAKKHSLCSRKWIASKVTVFGENVVRYSKPIPELSYGYKESFLSLKWRSPFCLCRKVQLQLPDPRQSSTVLRKCSETSRPICPAARLTGVTEELMGDSCGFQASGHTQCHRWDQDWVPGIERWGGEKSDNEETNQETLKLRPTDFRASHRVNKGKWVGWGWKEEWRTGRRHRQTDRSTGAPQGSGSRSPSEPESLVLKSCV